MSRATHSVEFIASGRGKAQFPPDPKYPNGRAIQSGGTPACTVKLPYPAPECGCFIVKCAVCQTTMAVTAAGRPDDPISVTVPCGVPPEAR